MINFLIASDACTTILGVVYFVRALLDILYIIIPIGLIIMISVDFAKGVINVDEGSKAVKFIVTRIIYAFAIILLPNVLFSAVGAVGINLSDAESCWQYIEDNDVETVKKLMEQKSEALEKKNEELQEKLNEQNAEHYEAIKQSLENGKKYATGSSSSGGTFNGQTYQLTDAQLTRLAGRCAQEQGNNVDGASAEASLMANLFELYGSSYGTGGDGLYNYVEKGGWFASYQGTVASQEVKDAVDKVFKYGQRTLPLYVNEHDCWKCNPYKYCSNGNLGDICSIKTDGKTETSLSKITERNNYVQDKTIITNVYGSVYTFYTFPTSTSDPFGYTDDAYKKIKE